jgi:hypothetical protein
MTHSARCSSPSFAFREAWLGRCPGDAKVESPGDAKVESPGDAKVESPSIFSRRLRRRSGHLVDVGAVRLQSVASVSGKPERACLERVNEPYRGCLWHLRHGMKPVQPVVVVSSSGLSIAVAPCRRAECVTVERWSPTSSSYAPTVGPGLAIMDRTAVVLGISSPSFWASRRRRLGL